MLNGPPGIGKSTLAAKYADQHPETLDLDIDRLARDVGDGSSPPSEAVGRARTLALGIARTHLESGRDVIIPQYVGRVAELERFEAVARDAPAVFCHLVLMDTRRRALTRFAERGRTTADDWLRQMHDEVHQQGGERAWNDMYDALLEVLRARVTTVLLSSEPGEIQRTYDELHRALDAETPPAHS